MMRTMRNTILACALFAAAAVPVSAQVYVTTAAPRAWLGITYDQTVIIHNGSRTSAVTVKTVSKGSPAEKAGLVAGDTIVKLNDFRASNDLLRSMGASVDVGDTVHVVVRRAGRDRDIAVVAAKRPPEQYTQALPGDQRVFRFDPDSVRGMMRLFVDSMYAGLDTTHMRMFRIDTTGFHRLEADSLFFGTMPNTVFHYGMNADSMRRFFPRGLFNDSMVMHLQNGVFPDSMFKLMPRMADSMFMRMPNIIPNVDRMIDVPQGVWEWKSESNTPDMVFHSFTLGQSAFAGAQLTNVNADLGDYFGTKTGALVLNVPSGTPAANAGLEAGDIITKVNGRAVANVSALRTAVEAARRGESIKLDVIRHQKAKSLELKRE